MDIQLQELLTKAAAQLGVAADLVWGVMLQQTKVELAVNIIAMALSALAIAAGLTVGIKMLKAYAAQCSTKERWERDEWLEPVGLLVAIVPPFFGLLALLFNIRETVQLIFNPPMWILEYLVRMFQ